MGIPALFSACARPGPSLPEGCSQGTRGPPPASGRSRALHRVLWACPGGGEGALAMFATARLTAWDSIPRVGGWGVR